MARVQSPAATIGGVLLALLTGLVGLAGFFSDLVPSETMTERLVFLVVAYAIGCGATGALLPRTWYVALVAAWGPVLVAIPALVAKIARGGPLPQWSFLAVALVAVPAATLLFAYAGSRLRPPRHPGDGE